MGECTVAESVGEFSDLGAECFGECYGYPM